MRLVDFLCPTHGLVAAAPPVSRVECKCGLECAPEGLTARQHLSNYRAARRMARMRNKPRAKAQVRAVRVPK